MFVVSGIILLAMSALIVIVSVSSSPIVISPSALILPVACKLPVTFVLPTKLIVPVPLGRNSKFWLVPNVRITLPSISISSICNLSW